MYNRLFGARLDVELVETFLVMKRVVTSKIVYQGRYLLLSYLGLGAGDYLSYLYCGYRDEMSCC